MPGAVEGAPRAPRRVNSASIHGVSVGKKPTSRNASSASVEMGSMASRKGLADMPATLDVRRAGGQYPTVRTIIIGGPSRGKSTLADEIRARSGAPVYCGDPASTVRYRYPYVTYLPEGLPFHGDGGGAAWIASNWLTMRGPWVIEGHALARALKRYLAVDGPCPADRIVVLDCPAHRVETPGQARMHLGVMTTWSKIARNSRIAHLVERRTELQGLRESGKVRA
jgi:hypothetical protein